MIVYGPADTVEEIIPFVQRIPDKECMWTEEMQTMQVNVGYLCNLACKHCHVSGGPNRTEIMSRETMEAILTVVKENPSFRTIDITGGSPEMNPHMEWFIREASRLAHVIVRSNLCVMDIPEYAHFMEVYKECGVEIFASLPYYSKKQMEKQRGTDSFDGCIRILQKLNALGYGEEGTGLILNLVYNPNGAVMAPTQAMMEPQFKRRLDRDFGIHFSSLYVITNNPIGRFGEFLVRSENLVPYMKKLSDAFNPDTVPAMMCRFQLSVKWDGTLYDCDFNQPIDLGITNGKTIYDYVGQPVERRQIRLANHCYACCAGAGSS